MAFIDRSEKITIISLKKEENDLGPGQYLSPEDPIQKIKPNKAPFLANSKKIVTLRKSVSPGPGSYFIDHEMKRIRTANIFKSEKDKQKFETIKALQTLNSEEIPNLSVMLNLDNGEENLGFNVKDARFKKDPNSYVPGPGYYIKSKDKSYTQTKKYTNLNIKRDTSVRKESDKTRVISIPSKYQSYGYELKEDGNIEMKNDPESFKRFKGDKYDSVGPGNYDIAKSTSWMKNGVEWSKSKIPRIKPIERTNNNEGVYDIYNITDNFNNKLNSKSFDNRQIDEFKKNASQSVRNFSTFYKGNKTTTLLKNNKVRKNNRETFYNEILDVMDFPNKTDQILRGISQETPGPGYYFKDDQPRKIMQYSNNQNFLSNQERFRQKSDINQIGPGYYFREEEVLRNFKKPLLNRREKSQTLNISREKKEKSYMNSQNYPGPGQYDTNIDVKGKKKFSNHSYFGSTERRFAELKNQKKENIPGPGYYFSHENNNGNKLMVDRLLFKDFRKRKVAYERPREIIDKNRNERIKYIFDSDVPPVGSYNSHKLFNIDYNLHKKLNKLTLVETAFSSTVSPGMQRFSMHKEENNGGPGYYYKNTKTPLIQVNPPFKANDKRFKQVHPQITVTGPGSYNHTSYHDWNKKTFNILYL